METSVKYYTNNFAIDLRRYYEISYDFRDKRYPFIGFMSEPLNSNKRQFITWGLDGVTATEHLHMFSSAIFYTTLFPQVIGKLYGVPAMEDFLAASGWPWMNCGLGGLMSPIHVIYNSGLRPKDEEIEAYKSRFNSATDYLVADFLNFFSLGAASLDAKAHKALVELVDVEKLRCEIDLLKDNFLRWIDNSDESYQSIYVPLENYPIGW